MRVVVVGREREDYTAEMEAWRRDFEQETNFMTEWLSPDTADGEMFTRLRDIVRYPAVVVVTDEGMLMNAWQGEPLPTFDDVWYYLRSL